MNWNLFLYEKLFIIILLFQIFHIANSISFDYPHYLTLSNDNIFIIHYTGIDIYNSSFNKINEVIKFSGREEMTEEIFAKIELKYGNEHILSIINDRIYIFNNEGKFLYKSEDKIIKNQTITNYALASIGLFNDAYKYTIGFFDDNKYLNLLFFTYNITEKNNTLLNITKDTRTDFNSTEEKQLSCEYMSTKFKSYNSKYRDILTCFFFYFKAIKTINYYISNNKLIYDSNIPSVNTYFFENSGNGQTFIKSEMNYNRSLAFIWYHLSRYHRTFYTMYNASSNQMINQGYYSYNCSSEIYKTKIKRLIKNKEIDLTFEINEKKLIVRLYNNIENYNNNISSFELSISCENFNGPKILYYNNNQNYYIYYCFKNCSNESYKNDSYCLNEFRKQRIKIIIICIIIAIIAIILLIISFFLYKRYLRKTYEKKLINKLEQSEKDEKVMNDILSELILDNN